MQGDRFEEFACPSLCYGFSDLAAFAGWFLRLASVEIISNFFHSASFVSLNGIGAATIKDVIIHLVRGHFDFS